MMQPYYLILSRDAEGPIIILSRHDSEDECEEAMLDLDLGVYPGFGYKSMVPESEMLEHLQERF